jgi:hypothetical protein
MKLGRKNIIPCNGTGKAATVVADAGRIAILARPYSTTAPEVEAILRLEREGMRVVEVPVDMRERTSGESKLQGKKAVMVVLTIAATLLAARRARHR